jgi:hypothetical protein
MEDSTKVALLANCIALMHRTNWPAGTERYRKVARFVRGFFDRLHDLRAPAALKCRGCLNSNAVLWQPRRTG